MNNTKMIEILSTTYVSPKRTLMVVRAHKQIFLVANSESGFTFLSEMSDVSGLMKEGEKEITGTNFDLNLSEAENAGLEALKLKENIMESSPVPEEKGIAALSAKDIVKFSDELKKKARNLNRLNLTSFNQELNENHRQDPDRSSLISHRSGGASLNQPICRE